MSELVGYDAFRVAEVAGNQVAYCETGAGEPLVMHHGAESHKGQYAIFTPLLDNEIRAISYDQRDVADAVSVDADYAMDDLADDCVGLLDALGIEKAHVMGMSFGGAIALNVGLRHPDRVQTLIVGAVPESFARPNDYLKSVMAAPQGERATLMRAASFSSDALQDDWLMSQVASLGRGTVTALGSRRRAAMESHDVRGRLQEISAPTLLVYGELDPIAPPEVGEEMKSKIPMSELVVLEGARHGLSFEFRDETATLINQWVLRHRIGVA